MVRNLAGKIVAGNHTISFAYYTIDGLVQPFIYYFFYTENTPAQVEAIRNCIIDGQSIDGYPY